MSGEIRITRTVSPERATTTVLLTQELSSWALWAGVAARSGRDLRMHETTLRWCSFDCARRCGPKDLEKIASIEPWNRCRFDRTRCGVGFQSRPFAALYWLPRK